MPRFFVSAGQIENGTVTVTGDDAFHISRSLRMAAGEHITVCDGNGLEYDCILDGFGESVTAKVAEMRQCLTEPPFTAVLWQALPKGDKPDSIIQKSVECGVSEINFFESERCIVRSDPKAEVKKTERRRRIALEAAKQCGRGIIPTVNRTLPFARMLAGAQKADLPLFCYEGDGTQTLGSVLRHRLKDCGEKPVISIVIGPEGGFSPAEVDAAKACGLVPVGLGKRILRTETAASFVLAALVYELEL